MATIQYLLLDPDNDPVFTDNTALTDLAAVTQAILTRLSLFLGEWWENLQLGLPVFQLMLGKPGSASGLTAMQAVIQQTVAGTPYVTSVNNVSVDFKDGRLTFTATAQTIFGVTTVNSTNTPGLSASLD